MNSNKVSFINFLEQKSNKINDDVNLKPALSQIDEEGGEVQELKPAISYVGKEGGGEHSTLCTREEGGDEDRHVSTLCTNEEGGDGENPHMQLPDESDIKDIIKEIIRKLLEKMSGLNKVQYDQEAFEE